jgi:ABC-type glutathione transport system ATPase component
VRDADQILVLERGEIVERGDHEQLLESGGVYAKLCQSGLFVDTDEQELIGANLEVAETPSAPETNL